MSSLTDVIVLFYKLFIVHDFFAAVENLITITYRYGDLKVLRIGAYTRILAYNSNIIYSFKMFSDNST